MSDRAIEVEWVDSEESLDYSEVLYLYLDRSSNSILYLGKADRYTVRQRLRGSHKDAVFDHIVNSLGIRRLEVLVGQLCLPEGSRFSRQLLGDVEALLIHRLRPPCNIQNTRSRPITRPGLSVACTGHWPAARARFIDR